MMEFARVLLCSELVDQQHCRAEYARWLARRVGSSERFRNGENPMRVASVVEQLRTAVDRSLSSLILIL
jgi:hypothetical protein